MDSVKNYFKGGKVAPPKPEDNQDNNTNRNSKRLSIRQSMRLSGVPSTISEGSPTPEFATWESLGEKKPEQKFDAGQVAPKKKKRDGMSRLSRLSFISNLPAEPEAETEKEEDIETARQNFRNSIAGQSYSRRMTMMEKTEMTDIQEDEIEEEDEGEEGEGEDDDDVADSITGTEAEGKYDQTVNVLEELKHEIMVNYLFQQQCARLWIADGTGEVEGVMLRKSRGNYLACPPALADSIFADSCVELNVQCAMTVNSRVIKTFLAWSPDAVDVPLTNGLRVQIIPTVADLPAAKKHQFAAFVAEDALLIVWDDDVHNLIKRAKFIEDELMELVWSAGDDVNEEEEPAKKGPGVVELEIDPITGEELPERRPTHLLNAFYVSITIVMIMTLIGATYRNIAIEISVDGSYLRLCFMLLTPLQTFFTLVSLLIGIAPTPLSQK